MAQTTLEQVIPYFTKGLNTLEHILDKATAHAQSQSLDPDATYFAARLIEDQLPLSFQVQNTTKSVNLTIGRLTGAPGAPFADDQKTIGDLKQRIQAARDLIASVDPKGFKDKEELLIEIPLGERTIQFTARDAALNQGVPNFFFHLNTAFSILRSKGVPIGKGDYIISFLGL